MNACRWIWIPDIDDTKQEATFVLFRRTFDLDQIPTESVLIRLSADTRYRLIVNGHRASFGPCKSFLEKWYFDEVDIGPFLKCGKNVLAVKILRFSPVHLGNSSMIRGPIPGFILQGCVDSIRLDTDEQWRGRADRSIAILPRSEWNFALGPPFLCLNERCDQAMSEQSWLDFDYDDSDWYSATYLSFKSQMMPLLEPRKLYPRPIPYLPEIDARFTGALVSSGQISCELWTSFLHGGQSLEIGPGQKVTVDIESEVLTTGFIQLVYEGDAGNTIEILCAESYERQHTDVGKIGASRFKADRRDFHHGELYGPVDRVITSAGLNSYEPFWFRVFRFIRLTIQTLPNQSLTLHSFSFRETKYPLDIQSRLHKQDGLDDLWKISTNTLLNCMHETYEDCPFYEQNQFAMDTRIMMLFTYHISRDDRLARKSIHEFYASRREDGLIQTHFPVPFRAINIPQFSLYWVLMVCDHHRYFGDADMARQYLGAMDGVFHHHLSRRETRGLVGRFDEESWPFVDWVQEWHGKGGLQSMAIPLCYHNGDGVVTYNSLLLAYVLQQTAALNSALGRHCVAEEYMSHAKSLITAVNCHCWDGEMYVDGPSTTARCQHSQIWAILASAIQGREASELMHRTITTPGLPKCSYSMSFYVFRAAAKVGLYDTYFEQLIQPWRKMIDNNMTTWAEDEVMFRSDCHGWSCSPLYEITSEIFGVSPAEPGYGQINIAPRFTLQREAAGRFVAGEATVEIAWDSKKNLTLKSDFDVVVNVTAYRGAKTRVLLIAGETFYQMAGGVESDDLLETSPLDRCVVLVA